MSAATTVAALALAGVSAAEPASAIGAPPSPRPESQPAVDTPQDLLREHQRASNRAVSAGTIAQRLKVAGADPALGSRVSAIVVDAATGAVIYSRNPTLALMPASNQKLTTAMVALHTMGASRTFRTEVTSNVERGTLYLKGAGDPALTSAQIKTLAATARGAVVKFGRNAVYVRVDDDLFPPPVNATGWKTSYVPGDVAPVRPLVMDGRNVIDTSLDAGTVFRNELVRLGIAVPSFARGPEAAGTVKIAVTDSPPLSTLVAQMLNSSNNDYAEAIHRQSALAAGKPATWAGANVNAFTTLQLRGVNTSGVAIHDGSGLSRSDRSSATSVASLLLNVSKTSAINSVVYGTNAMPTAGVSGTLATRFAQTDTKCARGKVRAKTGTLSDVTALSGTAYGVDGKQRIFSIIENGAGSTSAARFALERFATAATGCN